LLNHRRQCLPAYRIFFIANLFIAFFQISQAGVLAEAAKFIRKIKEEQAKTFYIFTSL
jgi:hypothetical protein